MHTLAIYTLRGAGCVEMQYTYVEIQSEPSYVVFRPKTRISTCNGRISRSSILQITHFTEFFHRKYSCEISCHRIRLRLAVYYISIILCSRSVPVRWSGLGSWFSFLFLKSLFFLPNYLFFIFSFIFDMYSISNTKLSIIICFIMLSWTFPKSL